MKKMIIRGLTTKNLLKNKNNMLLKDGRNMKKILKVMLVCMLAVALITVPVFASSLDGVAKNAETTARNLGGSAIAIFAIVWAAKEFLRRDVVKGFMVIVGGAALTIFISKPEWVNAIGSDLMSKLMG